MRIIVCLVAISFGAALVWTGFGLMRDMVLHSGLFGGALIGLLSIVVQGSGVVLVTLSVERLEEIFVTTAEDRDVY